MVAEFVAGQLIPYSNYSPRSEESLLPVFEEFNLTDDKEHPSMAGNQLPQSVEDFAVDGWMVANAIRVLDCDEEVRIFKHEDGMFEGQ
jgi:hypothetical protein